jgi:hypothetical protein
MRRDFVAGGLLVLAVGSFAGPAASSYDFELGPSLDYELVSTRPWPEVCRLYKDALSRQQGPGITFAGEVDITRIGDWMWNVQGLTIGLPLEPGGEVGVLSTFKAEGGGGAAFVKPEGRRMYAGPSFSVSYYPGLYASDHWDPWGKDPDPERLALSQTLFGERIEQLRMHVKAFNKTPDDLACESNTRATDVQTIVMLLGKRRTSLPGSHFDTVYSVCQGDWRGLYWCSESEGGQYSVSIDAYTDDLVLRAHTQAEGECPAFEQIRAGD